MPNKNITVEDIKAIKNTKSDELRKEKMQTLMNDFVSNNLKFDTKEAFILCFDEVYILGDFEPIPGLDEKFLEERGRLFPLNKDFLKKLDLPDGLVGPDFKLEKIRDAIKNIELRGSEIGPKGKEHSSVVKGRVLPKEELLKILESDPDAVVRFANPIERS